MTGKGGAENLKAAAGGVWTRAALYFASAMALADMYLTQPILPALSQEFGVAPVTAGFTVSATVLSVALASIAIGPLSDVWGRKPVMVASCALLAVPTALCGLSESFPALVSLRALQGFCIPGLTGVGIAYLAELYGPAALGGAVGGWIASNVAGGLTGRVAGGLLSDAFGWRSAFLVFAALTLVSAAALQLFLPNRPPSMEGTWKSAYGPMFAHLLNRRLLGAFLIGGALFFGFIGVYTYLPYYLTGPPFSLPPGLVAYAFLSYLAGIAVSPVAGRLSSRRSRRGIIAGGLAIALAGTALTLIPNLWAVGASLVVLCVGMFTAQAVAPAFVNTLAEHSKGGASALYQMFFYLGGTLGAVLPGLAWQTLGWAGVVGACASAFAVALWAAVFLCADGARA